MLDGIESNSSRDRPVIITRLPMSSQISRPAVSRSRRSATGSLPGQRAVGLLFTGFSHLAEGRLGRHIVGDVLRFGRIFAQA